AGRAESGQRGVGLVAFLGKMPLVDAANARAGALAQNDQAALEFFVFQRLEFVKNWEKHNRRELREQDKESEENNPCDHPPVLRSLAHQQVEQFDYDRGHDQADQKALAFVPEPGAECLVGQVIAVLDPETAVLQRSSQHFADQEQHHDVKENGERVILRSATFRQIAERSGPAGGQEHNEQPQADREIGDAQPALGAVVAVRFRRIGENWCSFFGVDHSEVLSLSYRVRRLGRTRKCWKTLALSCQLSDSCLWLVASGP